MRQKELSYKIEIFLLFTLFFTSLFVSDVLGQQTDVALPETELQVEKVINPQNEVDVQTMPVPRSKNIERNPTVKEKTVSTKPVVDDKNVVSSVAEAENILVAWVRQGGMSIYLIILCSLAGTYFIIERLLTLRSKNIVPKEFVNSVFSKLLKAKTGVPVPNLQRDLINFCEENDSPISRVLRAGLMVTKEGPVGVRNTIDGSANFEGAVMEKNLTLLGLTANLAPLLGFLGTVTGMIAAFESIVQAKSIGAEIVAGGISKALVTTAAGLFVGIPLLTFYHFIQGKIDGFMIEINEIANKAIESVLRLGEKS